MELIGLYPQAIVQMIEYTPHWLLALILVFERGALFFLRKRGN